MRIVFWEARTRILTWYVLLMAFFMAVSIPLISEVLNNRVDERVHESLAGDMEEFQKLIKERNSTTRQRSAQEIADLFDKFLDSRLPEDDEFLIALLDGQLYKSSPRALPEQLQQDSKLVNRWLQLTQHEQGEEKIPNSPVGNILYVAEPIEIGGKIRGVFIVAHTTAGEHGEVFEAVTVVLQVTIAVLAISLILAWVAAGRVLAPLRSLTATARSISESDLNKRIPVKGSGEIIELAKTFNEMMDRLQNAFTSQQNFINDASHELRTPITIVRGHLELLGDDPEEKRETLELVIGELDRMSRFVNDLILLAKAERPDFLRLETVEIGSLTQELYAKAKAMADRDWQLDAKGSSRIVADRQRLTQAIMNLAQNAIQHTTEGDVIALGSAIDKGYARFWVRDTGEGIAPADQQQIFERFARMPNSRRRSEGAGLGLSIVRAIAEAHGAWVEINSRPGAGSTFTIIIPLEPPQEVLL